MRFSRWLVSRVVPELSDDATPQERARVGLLEGWVSVGVNVGLFALKMVLGVMSNSVSLIADAAHTLSDSLTSIVVIFGFRLASRPPDEQHPFGHGRIENVSAVVIAVLLGVVSVEMLMASVNRLFHPRPLRADLWIIGVLIGTIILKELLYRFSRDLAAMIDSDVLRADAWHHRSDMLSTILVLAAFIGAQWHAVWLDGTMGIGVAIIIGVAAAVSMRAAVGPLIGGRAPEELYREIEEIARAPEEVRAVHDILVHRYGATNIISLHIEVPDTESPMRLHDLSEEIEEKLAARFPGHAIVHVDPINRDHQHYEEVGRIVSDAIAADDCAESFHDLRVLGGSRRFRVAFDVTGNAEISPARQEELRQAIEQRLRERFPLVRVIVNVEPLYFRSVSQPEDDAREDAS